MSHSTTYIAIQATIEAGERLTKAQGRSLLDYARMQSERAEKFAQSNARLQQIKDEMALDLEVEMERHGKLIAEWNELGHMLDEVLGTKVYCNELDGNIALWTVEYQGKTSRGHRSVADAYRAALSEIVQKEG